MRRLLLLPLSIAFLQCANGHDTEIITETVFVTDTIYLTPNGAEYEEPPWLISCGDTAMTQADMNIYSGKMYVIADSVMQGAYSLLDSLCTKKINTNLNYSHQDEFSLEALEFLRKMQHSLHQLQATFYEYRELAEDFERSAYYSATMQPVMINSTGLSVTANHIRILESLTTSIR